MRILIGNLLRHVEHQYDNIAIFDCLHCFHDGILFGEVLYASTSTHASRIDERIDAAVALEVDRNAVARRSRLIVRNYPFLTEQGVDQGRFADIRSPDDGYSWMLPVRWRDVLVRIEVF